MKYIKSALLALALGFASVTFAQPVDINAADAETLATVKGIGPAKAASIIAWRDANGAFGSVYDLTQVRGIGMKTVEQNEAMLTVGDAAQK
ncbi:MAG: ComEA family DNA-binding protein [Gammaproteobacteria bacterium]|jgi:competence protein ComEA|nr:ComEA family DNA-binding protein [Gammaproteobacteria bacterium]